MLLPTVTLTKDWPPTLTDSNVALCGARSVVLITTVSSLSTLMMESGIVTPLLTPPGSISFSVAPKTVTDWTPLEERITEEFSKTPDALEPLARGVGAFATVIVWVPEVTDDASIVPVCPLFVKPIEKLPIFKVVTLLGICTWTCGYKWLVISKPSARPPPTERIGEISQLLIAPGKEAIPPCTTGLTVKVIGSWVL